MTTIVKKVLSIIWSHNNYVLFTMSCETAVEPEAADRDFNVTIIDKASIATSQDECHMLRQANKSNGGYLSDISRGRAQAVLIDKAGEFAHHGFYFRENRMHQILGLDQVTALVGHAFTAGQFRGKGLQATSLNLRARLARKDGFECICAETGMHNLPSQRGMEKAGMVRLGELQVIRIFWAIVIRPRRPAGMSLFDICF